MTSTHTHSCRRQARAVAGFGLIELMLALLLGLLVVGAAGTIFISNQKSYRATESLGRVQEGARVAFELMARDIREAAGNPCSKNIPLANVLKASTNWWSTWGAGVQGYDGATALPGHAFGTGIAERATGTDAIDLRGAYSGGVSVTDHTWPSAQFKVSTKDHGLVDGDIVMVCDYKQAATFQVTNAQSGTNVTVVHNASNSDLNCSKGLGYKNPMVCTTNGTEYVYGKNSVIVKMRASQWYIGHNGNGGLSLYQSAIRNAAGVITTDNSEITDGVKDMTLEYLEEGKTAYAAAASVADWKKVKAVRILVELESQDRISNKGEKVLRQLSHVATIRNRVE